LFSIFIKPGGACNFIKKQLKKLININLVEDVFEKANDNNGS
jgi:hypothetical protein